MKSIITTIVCFIAIFASSNAIAQNTKTFYVCSNTNFTMDAAVTTFPNYQWTEVGGTSISTSASATVTAPTITGTVYTTKRYVLSVKDSVGCWSETDTFTVYVLPPVQVAISGNNGPYCANSSTTETLSAVVGGLTLPSGVTADSYAWTLNGTATGTNSSTLGITTGTTVGTNTYAVTVSYKLPAVNGGSKLSSCQGQTNTVITVKAAPTTPSISIR